MTVSQAMLDRHAVRSYSDKAIPSEVVQTLRTDIDAINKEAGLHIQLVTNDAKAFDSMMARYGKFSGVRNYIALIGPKSQDLDEKLGYYGERLALKAQALGLNTCWVAMTFSKGSAKKNLSLKSDEKLICVLSLGYGTTQGVAHQSKGMDALAVSEGEMPEWFKEGMQAAMLAPTATNQQKFRLTRVGNTVKAENLGGFYSKLDLGIVKHDFEAAAGKENFTWA